VASRTSARVAAGRFGVSTARRLVGRSGCGPRVMPKLCNGRRSPFAPSPPPRGGVGAGRQAAGPDLTRNPHRGGDRAWDKRRADEFVAVSQGAEDHAKKSLHAAERGSPDVAEARRASICPASRRSIPTTWSSSTRLGLPPIWHAAMAGRPRLAANGAGAARALEGDLPGGRPALQRHHRAVRLRRRQQWRTLSRLC